MGCICSKETAEEEPKPENHSNPSRVSDKSSVQLVAPAPAKTDEISSEIVNKDASIGKGNESGDNENVQHGSDKHHRMDRIISIPRGAEGELVAAGWPHWLTSAAGEAIKGWIPRRADSFEKLEKIGQGTYSIVYKARDLETRKIVAMKKVRFMNMDPESVRFMAREIHILRKLDHPNVMKLEGIVTSRMSGSLYLVFEYMEHDLSGLAATPGIKFTEPQIKCYMQQLFRGLQHCHQRGILHRDIKGSNLLVNDDGVLKIGDFGLANFFQPGQDQALTSRVVTLWYRAPELLFGASKYGVAIDLWSAGCILAELFAGKPIMPGRTEVEQMHKIFKLCGSPSEDYWKKTTLPKATTFKSQNTYKRCIKETFKHFPPSALALVDKLLSLDPDARGSATSALSSKFFSSEPLPCDPSSLPKYPPSKELDAKLREEARRQREEAIKQRGAESVRRGSTDLKAVPTPEFIAQGQKKAVSSYKYDYIEDSGSGFPIDPPRGTKKHGFSHSTSMIHPSVSGQSLNKNEDLLRHKAELRMQMSHRARASVDASSNSSHKRGEQPPSAKETSVARFVPKKNRMNFSGPLMPHGGNIEEILKEHERQIQEAVRKTRMEKSGTKQNHDGSAVGKHQAKCR